MNKWMVLAIISVACVIGVVFWVRNEEYEKGPWYLGCIDLNGQQYLVKLDGEPEIRDGLIFIGKRSFITPRQGMTCSAIHAKDIPESVLENLSTSNSA